MRQRPLYLRHERLRIGGHGGAEILVLGCRIRAGIGEIIGSVGDDVEQVLGENVVPVGRGEIDLGMGRVEIVIPAVAERTIDTGRIAECPRVGVNLRRLIKTGQLCLLALRREGVLRVQRAVGRGASDGRATGADIDRQQERAERHLGSTRSCLTCEVFRRARIPGLGFVEIEHGIGLRPRTDIHGRAHVRAQALNPGAILVILVDQILLADSRRIG